jgi:hypothetical protein
VKKNVCRIPSRPVPTTLPAWTDVRSPKDTSRFSELGPGEREAISLALETTAAFKYLWLKFLKVI